MRVTVGIRYSRSDESQSKANQQQKMEGRVGAKSQVSHDENVSLFRRNCPTRRETFHLRSAHHHQQHGTAIRNTERVFLSPPPKRKRVYKDETRRRMKQRRREKFFFRVDSPWTKKENKNKNPKRESGIHFSFCRRHLSCCPNQFPALSTGGVCSTIMSRSTLKT